MSDTISRQNAIDALNDGAELLRCVLDGVDIVGAERAKYEFGLGLLEACISDMKELPSAQPKPLKYSGTSICCYCKTTDCDGCLYEPMTDRCEE